MIIFHVMFFISSLVGRDSNTELYNDGNSAALCSISLKYYIHKVSLYRHTTYTKFNLLFISTCFLTTWLVVMRGVS